MWFRTLFDNLLARSCRTPSRKRRLAPSVRRRSRSFAPLLEILEARCLLTAPQILLTPTVLADLRQEAASNTPQWQAFKARLDNNLDVLIAENTGSYEGSQLAWIDDYALGYQVLQTSDPQTADNYADKAIGLMKSGLNDYQTGSWVSRQYLARGDGTTTTFTLPNADFDPSTLTVYLSNVSTQAVVHQSAGGQDVLPENDADNDGYNLTYLKVSNTPDGPADYTEGTDWTHNPNDANDEIDWSNAANQPAVGATYYVTYTSGEEYQYNPNNINPTTAYTLKGDTITFNQAPGENQAIFVEYIYGTHSANGSTLAYQQTSAGDGGFNNIFIDDAYSYRFLGTSEAIGLDWLDGYAGMTPAFEGQVETMLVRWSNYMNAASPDGGNPYLPDSGASNYGATDYEAEVLTAVALAPRDTTDGPGLVKDALAWRQNNLLPVLENTTTSDFGGYWAEGWNYGTEAVQAILIAGDALQTAGLITDTPEAQFADQVMDSLVEEESSPGLTYDGGEDYQYPFHFVDKSLFYVLSQTCASATEQSYANYVIQNYPDSDFGVGAFGGSTPADYEQLLFDNPSAPASFWSALPLADFASGTGLMTARSDWGSDPTWVATQIGNYLNAGHQFPINMEINRGPDQLLINAYQFYWVNGNGSLTPDTDSFLGNLMVINDPNDPDPPNMGLASFDTTGVVDTAYENTAAYTYFDGNYAAAYGEGVSQLTRQVVFVRPGLIFVYDRATTTSASYSKTLQWNFLTAPTVNGDSFVETVGSSSLFGQMYSTVPISTSLSTIPDGSNTPLGITGTPLNIQQLATTTTTATTSVNYVTVFQAAPSTTTTMDPSEHILSNNSVMEGSEIDNQVVLFGSSGAVASNALIAYTFNGQSAVQHLLVDLVPNQTYDVIFNGTVESISTSDQGTLTFSTPAGVSSVKVTAGDYVVTSTADDGSTGTLRDAINQVNAGKYNEIVFDISGKGVQTINLTSALPAITASGVFINGTSENQFQGGASASPLIELNGSVAGSSGDGLLLQGSSCTVSGLILEDFTKNGIEVDGSNNTIGGTTTGAGNVISGNTTDGVLIDSGVSGVQVQGNYIGTNTAGNAALANSVGIDDAGNSNTIGGTASGARNIISGNSTDGVLIASGVSGTQVQGNYIGLNAAGTAALGNGVGIADAGTSNTLGGSVSGGRNVISGNSADGVLLASSASGETVQSNYIGLTHEGNVVLANGSNGVEVQGTKNTIGGNSGSNSLPRNYITGNGGDGVRIDSGATGNQVLGNFIGVDISGTNGLGNVGNGVEIAGNGNTIGGTVSGLTNVISASSKDGLLIDSGATGNLVAGNYVGTDYTGKKAVSNKGSGVEVAGNGNTLGGTTAAARNVIAANNDNGVQIDSGVSGTLVQGNSIGVNSSSAALGNNGNGVDILGPNNTIGGTASGARNIISANTADGVLLASGASGNLVLGNYIGLNNAGSAALGNSGNGVEIASNSNTIGGTTSTARNYISGNSKDGVLLASGVSANQVMGNYIGLNTAGTAALANSVGIEDAGSGNTLGGSVSGAHNYISGNTHDGILLDSSAKGEAILGNYIGLNGNVNAAVANGSNGVEVQGTNNTVGGTIYNDRNFLSGNGNDGELIGSASSGNLVLGNFIGLDITGTHGVGNAANAVEIAGSGNTIGGTASGSANFMSASTKDGVLLDNTASANLILGNDIGTDYTGEKAASNSGNGIEVMGTGNTLGGTASGTRNIVSGNSSDGVRIDSGASGNLVEGNYIGINSLSAALGNGGNGVNIAGTKNTVGGTVSGARNIISANSSDGLLLASGASGNVVLGDYIGLNSAGSAGLGNSTNGVEIASNSNTIGGTTGASRNYISANSKDGVLIDSGASGNQMQGNYIGLNTVGTGSLANSVGIEDAGTGNVLGGSVSGGRNVISGNSNDGILLDSTAKGEAIEGNFVGLTGSGNAALANGSNGIEVQGVTNTIGGTIYNDRNFISGNGNNGVLIDSGSSANLVLGNFIGVDVSGTHGVGNVANGMKIAGSSNTIGSTASGGTNVISANINDGMLLDSTATANLVQSNYVGTDYTGKIAVANVFIGIEVKGNGNTLGGTTGAARNIIAGNSNDGVRVDSGASGTLVQGNYIGLNASSAALGNGSYGVEIDGSNNTIGNGVSGAANAIANNASGGVLVSTGVGDTISQDSIFANGGSHTGPGIVLSNGGNNNLAAPTLTSASVSGTTLTVKGSFTPPTANVKYTLEFFASPSGDTEGKVFLAVFHDTPPNTNPQSFTYNITTSVTGTDPVITATLTDGSGDTSAFSAGASTAAAARFGVGAVPITNGPTASNEPLSGGTTGIAADPANANTISITATDSGMWKTTNAATASPSSGLTWPFGSSHELSGSPQASTDSVGAMSSLFDVYQTPDDRAAEVLALLKWKGALDALFAESSSL